jgi:hypothetical protein
MHQQKQLIRKKLNSFVDLSNVYDAVILMGVAILTQKLGKN